MDRQDERFPWAALVVLVVSVQWPALKGLYYRAADVPPPPSLSRSVCHTRFSRPTSTVVTGAAAVHRHRSWRIRVAVIGLAAVVAKHLLPREQRSALTVTTGDAELQTLIPSFRRDQQVDLVRQACVVLRLWRRTASRTESYSR